MSTKTNANAHAIISNMNKFKIGDGYTYKDICMICKIKEYKSGSNSRNKQMGTFNELFNIEESKRGKAVIYTIISKKEITDIYAMSIYFLIYLKNILSFFINLYINTIKVIINKDV